MFENSRKVHVEKNIYTAIRKHPSQQHAMAIYHRLRTVHFSDKHLS
jgi:ABC-type transport system involved in Fe-S cluster assembly fused permease/ATPase subunit